MSYTPINSDAPAVAAYTIARANATVPSSGAVTSDEATAIADSYLGAVGGLGSGFINDAAALGTASTTSTSFVDVGNGSTTGFSSWTTPAIPIAKTYWIWCRLSSYVTVGGGRTFFQLLVDGVAPSGQPASAQRIYLNVTSQQFPMFFIVPVFLSAATHVIKPQWRVDSGVTAQVDVNDGRLLWITG